MAGPGEKSTTTAPPAGRGQGEGGRLREPPAPELVAAAFRTELADAPILHRGLGQADLAHVIALAEAGIPVEVVKKLQEGHPNLIDHLIDGRVQRIFNTPRGKGARTDEGRIRARRRRRATAGTAA